MASAVLTSRNDPRSTNFTNSFTNNSNHHFMKFQHIQNPNPNLNPNFSRFFVGNSLPVPSQRPAFNRSSSNSLPANFNGYRHITFRLSSYSKRELKELKKRLISDLERVRIVQKWICNIGTTPIPKMNHQLAAAGVAVCRKRTNPLPPVRVTRKKQRRKMMMTRECSQMLCKLMKHKHGWVFNTPVDAAALKLYDYHNIITNPMDLGTVKSKLDKNEYESVDEFASDVRLTFNNAMVYNGEGSDVFVMAERLLVMFEGLFDSFHPKFGLHQVKNTPFENENENVVVAANAGGLKKREMTVEEKSELAASFADLQLGPEGMDEIVAILKKGVLGLEHHQGDEIELDLAVLDNDTLWALHRFICRIRKFSGNEHVVEEEDINIGNEMQSTIFPPCEIEKDVVNVSSSESSSYAGSSSSGYGSGTCSGNSYNEQAVYSTPKVVHD